MSSTHRNRSESPLVFLAASNADTDEWVKAWKLVTAHGTNHSRQYVSCIWTGSDATPQILSNLQLSQSMQIKAWRLPVMCVGFAVAMPVTFGLTSAP